MTEEGKFYFMSRPRRFGKSLTVSTLRSLFQGRKDLFDGLWIKENTDWQWKPHPVIMTDFNEISHDTPENLRISLQRSLKKTGEIYDVVSDASLIKDQFKEMILSLYHKTGMPVVILIDEYDKPLIDHLGKGEKSLEIAKANRDILKYFFGVIKGGLQKEDFNAFFETLTAIFASIPYTLESKRDEAYFHTLFYLMICDSGVNAHSEVLTCDGRIDLMIEFPDKVFIIEFKCNLSAEAGISHIREKGYDQKFKQSGKKIILMGINFDTEKRNITDWKTV